MAELSPMMRQYLKVKEENPDCLLFFRLGDFYEMFFEDAKTASKELDLVLTGRDCGLEERAPMCGVPYHSCEGYIARLVQRGYKVAICEQMEDPSLAKGLVKREVTRVITPGTIIEDSMLDETRNNFLCTVFEDDGDAAVCFVDASTGEMHLTGLPEDNRAQKICNELGRFMPCEILINLSAPDKDEILDFIENRIGCRVECKPDEMFCSDESVDIVKSHFKRDDTAQIGLPSGSATLYAVGAALGYLYETQRAGLENISGIDIYTEAQYMQLDLSTRRNLELLETMRGHDTRGSLLWVMDKTGTAMGKRMIRSWLEQPLLNPAQIMLRQNGVAELYADSVLRGEIMEALSGVYDLERLMTRVLYGTANPRELKSMEYTLSKIPGIKSLLVGRQSSILNDIQKNIDELRDIHDLISAAIVDDAPISMKDGEVIKSGYNEEIDLLRSDMSDGRGFITRIENQERERTGIKNLRIRYNKVFGYYIEVTNSFKDLVPPEYIRKQTLTNCERYITDELKKQESRVLGAQERLNQLEYQLFDDVRRQIAGQLHRVQRTASEIARLDVLCSFAEIAVSNSFTRPNITLDGRINIKNGRHPVVERFIKAPFVPNDTVLDMADNRCAIITGPNMAGKSTYMRQVAIIVLLAQTGSFVPAEYADIGICDAIFTRVGASDDLSAGQSTFMVEMSEVAYILDNATPKSLLVFDEIGRGTSTFDGMSIARAVLEFVCNKKKLGAKTLFATHYHELTELEDTLDGVKNFNTAVKKRGDDITFLRRIVRGPADGSYGIEVAKLAGIPDDVVHRARKILRMLEESGQTAAPAIGGDIGDGEEEPQISFAAAAANDLMRELKILDVNTLTPIEAMSYLYKLVEQAKNL
jgi:DNA mismatch repair protein MutS